MKRVAKIVRKGIKSGDSRFSPEMGFNLSCIVIYLFLSQACAGTTWLYRLPAYALPWFMFNPTITSQPLGSQAKNELLTAHCTLMVEWVESHIQSGIRSAYEFVTD